MRASHFTSERKRWRVGAITVISLLIALMASTSGCSTARYLVQATRGQLSLLNHAKPIDEVVRDQKTPPRTRALLGEIGAIKNFGEKCGLKPTENYTEFVKLDRPAAVYVVSACEPLEFKSKEWNFPIVGRFPYLGWFDLAQAKEFAKDLGEGTLDVDVRGAAAYSTLGWFRDAVLSSMIREGDEALGELVNVVLHESVHATLYISGQAYFNESVASYVADRLTEDYLDLRPGAVKVSAEQLADHAPAMKASAFPDRSPSQDRLAYLKDQAEGERRTQRMHQAYNQLAALYASNKTVDEKRAEKVKILAELKNELGFRREINNATLIQFKTYSAGSKDFDELWKSCGGDSSRFMTTLSKLKESSFQKTQQEDLSKVLLPLIQEKCVAPTRS